MTVWQDELGCSIYAGVICVDYAQGYGTGRYDIVFASNVLHTTRDVGRALQQCKALLRKGGLLVADELSTKTLLLSLTFGLTEGWWRYDDESRRITGGPAFTASEASNPLLDSGRAEWRSNSHSQALVQQPAASMVCVLQVLLF